MKKSNILQIIAMLLLLIGFYSLYAHFSFETEITSILSGIGPIMMGVALMVISKSKAIDESNSNKS